MGDFPQFGTDGIRGLANEALTPDVAVALGRAAAEVLGGERVIIGRDTRRSGPMLEAGLVAGYNSAGMDVELLGVVPTPTVAWVAKDAGVGGAMISASHNPFADNGIKLFAVGGTKLSDKIESNIQARFHQLLGTALEPGPSGASVGTVVSGTGHHGWLEAVINSVSSGALRGMNIVVDCANGSASDHAAQVFERLGATVTIIGNNPDGLNINSGCGSTQPEVLAKAVRTAGADAGLAFDGDADRLIAVDGNGEIVDGDHILAILASDWKRTGRLNADTVVVTVMSNLGFHRAMEAAGIAVVTTGVGDRYVLEALADGNYSLGGEQSGHVICRALATTGDGILAGVQLLDAIKRSSRSLAAVAAEAMTTVPQILRNVRLDGGVPAADGGGPAAGDIIAALADDVAAAEAEMGSDGRVLIRPSGTEPLLRIMVEHIDDTIAPRICGELVDRVNQLVEQNSPTNSISEASNRLK